ncbi:MAG: hypothetical protein FWC73_11330 [Defluviitaleaceae bacterium]|nr:hypothetical protein [Defluviitaleaceae bacterium]
METMNRRQRVLAAINHQTPDRMPIDLGVHFSTGISAFAYKRLREHLGLYADIIDVPDPVQMLARVERDVLERFRCDTMLLNPELKSPVRWDVRGDYSFLVSDKAVPTQKENGDWIVSRGDKSMRMPKGGYFFDGDWLGVSDYASEEEELKAYAARAERIYKETDYFTMQMGFYGFFSDLEFACLMLTDPDEAIQQQEEHLAYFLARAEKVLRMYGEYIQCIEINSDLGTQSAPFLRPEHYEEFCMPYLKKFNDFIHRNSDIKIFMHSCGSVEPLIPYIIEAGVDILNPVQISADNMDPAVLKEKYGDKICFWGGGCDTQNILPNATPEEVKTHVREMVGILKPGGGFVFNQVHNIMGDVPPENIVAMFDTAYEESFY